MKIARTGGIRGVLTDIGGAGVAAGVLAGVAAGIARGFDHGFGVIAVVWVAIAVSLFIVEVGNAVDAVLVGDKYEGFGGFFAIVAAIATGLLGGLIIGGFFVSGFLMIAVVGLLVGNFIGGVIGEQYELASGYIGGALGLLVGVFILVRYVRK